MSAAARAGLPWLGLGISTNLQRTDLPQPYRLLDARPGAFDFVEYSAPLDVDEARREATLFETMWARRAEVPALFHPVHLNLWGPELEPEARLEALDRHLTAVGSPWVGNDVAWWHAGGEMFPGYVYLSPPLTERALADCVRHALHVQARVSVPLLLENPAFFALRGPLHVVDFMAALHQRTGCGLVLDLGHLLSHQLARGVALDDGLERLPLDAVVEIHLAGGVVTRHGPRAVYVDDHSLPVREELFGLLERLVAACPRLRAVTFEGDGHPDALALVTLERLRPLVPREREVTDAARTPEVGPPSDDAATTALDAAACWALFDATFSGSEDPEDPAASRAETDYRLTVLADRLDRAWPLTRLMAAPGRDELLAFSASRELRDGFEGRALPLTARFGRWARRRLVAERRAGALAALALETWAQQTLQSAPPPEPPPGHVGLGTGVRLGMFPTDPSELLHAAGALRRHLTGRALTAVDPLTSGLAVLEDVALRAPMRPTTLAVRPSAHRVELVALTAAMARVLGAARATPPTSTFFAAHPEDAPEVREALALGLLRLG